MITYLAKTEPGTYSIDDLEREGETLWDGVHNYEAINYIKAMKPGDRVYIYHSMTDKRIVGIAEVTAMPFLNTDDPRHSWAVRLKFLAKVIGPLLKDFKEDKTLPAFKLVSHSRLSVMEVPNAIVDWIEQRTRRE
jgi:predicted RNA-binding protein with PUA-like domain